MRVATWNINGIQARLDFVLHWLAARKPDVVGIQELKQVDAKFPHEAFRAAGYHAATYGQKSWNGVAVLSREPLEVTERGLPGTAEDGARLITVAAGELSFTTVYVPNGKHIGHEDFPRKLGWLDALTAHLASVVDRNAQAIVCGDFNLCPGPLDSWNEELLTGGIFHTREERACHGRLLDVGFVDVFREHLPKEVAFSWWDYRGGAFHRRQGLRIDLILGTRAVMDRVRTVEIDREYRKKQEGLTPSDHAPVIADLE